MYENEKEKCMNIYCGAKESSRWRSGWLLLSRELAILCNICGTLYEKGNFCTVFHAREDGWKEWKECVFCKTPIHCGCIASGYSLHNGPPSCRNCVCTQISDKSEDGGDGEAAKEETESVSDGNSPHTYMVDGFEIKAYKLPPVVTTIRMRKRDNAGEGDEEIDDNEGMVQSDPPPTTKHGKHRDGCGCVVCTQHPKGNPHRQNCECRGCAIYLKRRKTTLTRSNKISLSAASASKRGRRKNTLYGEGDLSCLFCKASTNFGSSINNGLCRNCASTHNDSDVHQENACDMTTCTQIPDKSDDGDEEAVEEETASETDKNSPQTYNMVDWSEAKAYERPPVITTIRMREEDDEGEGDEDDHERMVQSDPPPTTKHGRHRDGCPCVVCTQHPKGNPHPQNCECRGCAINLKRKETALRRAKNSSLSAASTSRRGHPKN